MFNFVSAIEEEDPYPDKGRRHSQTFLSVNSKLVKVQDRGVPWDWREGDNIFFLAPFPLFSHGPR